MPTTPSWALAALAFAAACSGPVRAPPPPSGELIVFGGGPGGPVDACFTCHGLNGEGEGATPRIAGTEAGYLLKQLNDYAHAARADDVMAPIARRLTDGDRGAVASYYAGRLRRDRASTTTAPNIYAHGSRERGVRACASCHGAAGEGRGLAFPAIAGQPRAYTIEQLRRFKRSVRRNDPRDVMGRAARPLSEAEIEAIAIYLERL